MFAKRLIVGAVALAFATIGVLTLQGGAATPLKAADIAAPINPALSQSYDAPIAHLEQGGVRPGASASNPALAGIVYHYDSVTNKWYATHYSVMSQGELIIDDSYEIAGDPFAAKIQVRGYAELKEAQLERMDATKSAPANITTADQEDFNRTRLPFASGWWEYRDDPLTNKGHAYHYVTTPTGPVIDATYEFQGIPKQGTITCGTTVFEPECFGSAGYTVK